MNNLNRPTTPTEIKVVIKILLKSEPMIRCINTEFYQTFSENLMPIFLKLLHETETNGTFLNSVKKAIVIVITKPHKDSTKIYRRISVMNINAKKSTKYFQTESENTSKIICIDQVGFITGMHGYSIYKSQHVFYHINKLKEKII